MTNREWRNDKITDKQLDLIEEIETILGIDFKGSTKGDAYDFISKHIEDAKNEWLDMEADYYSWKNEH